MMLLRRLGPPRLLNAAAVAHARRMFSSSSSSSSSTSSSSSSSSTQSASLRDRNATLAMYAGALVIGVAGLSYASVPLYQMFCQATGYGGTTQQATEEQFKNMKPVAGARPLTVNFSASTSSSMPWKFVPQQTFVRVVPGETALAFFTAHNPTDTAVTGVSTYNVTPARAGLYFHKIQCFCFEEQRLRPHEEIDMPVFFYVDPEFLNDPSLAGVRTLTLSYTFFRTGDMEVISYASQPGGPLDAARGAEAVAASLELPQGLSDGELSARVRNWTREMAEKTGTAAAAAAVAAAAAAGSGSLSSSATAATSGGVQVPQPSSALS